MSGYFGVGGQFGSALGGGGFQQAGGDILSSFTSLMPNDMGLVNAGVRQGLATPSVQRNLESPRGAGVGFNSPSRLMSAFMGAAGMVGNNAAQRQIAPLSAMHENAMTGLEQFGNKEQMRQGINSIGQGQYINDMQIQQGYDLQQLQQDQRKKQMAQSMLMGMLGPMFGQLTEGAL